MSLSALGQAVMSELENDAQFDNRRPYLQQDDDVTSSSAPLSNPQSRRIQTEVHNVA